MYDSECHLILSKSGPQCTCPGSTPTQSPVPCAVEVSSTDRAASQTFCAALGRAQLGPRGAVYQWCCAALARKCPSSFPWAPMGHAGDQKPFLSPAACTWQSHIICRCHGIAPLLCRTHGKCYQVGPSALPGKATTFKPWFWAYWLPKQIPWSLLQE